VERTIEHHVLGLHPRVQCARPRSAGWLRARRRLRARALAVRWRMLWIMKGIA
jgi:hypothetical protein